MSARIRESLEMDPGRPYPVYVYLTYHRPHLIIWEERPGLV